MDGRPTNVVPLLPWATLPGPLPPCLPLASLRPGNEAPNIPGISAEWPCRVDSRRGRKTLYGLRFHRMPEAQPRPVKVYTALPRAGQGPSHHRTGRIREARTMGRSRGHTLGGTDGCGIQGRRSMPPKSGRLSTPAIKRRSERIPPSARPLSTGVTRSRRQLARAAYHRGTKRPSDSCPPT